MKFEAEYKKLNGKQRQAVDAIEGPVMVVAGPGTGKTQILALRIANILEKTDTEPENILAITFTESGVYAMRKRLADLIGAAGYRVEIKTFHGFCNNVIQEYPEEFSHIIGSRPAAEVDQIEILEGLIERMTLKVLKPFGDHFYYIKASKAAIEDLKKEGVDEERFIDLVRKEKLRFERIDDLYYAKGQFQGRMRGKYKSLEKQIEKNAELGKIYKEYQKELKKRRLYDFTDMIMEVVRAMEKNKDLLYALQERYQYVLVDEHQDSNNGQNKLLELLMSFFENPNLFVVGDEKQAIFRFQGASLENFLYFQRLYPKAKLIKLEDNYRSTQNILDAASSLMKRKNDLKANVKFKSAKIKLAELKTLEQEREFVAGDIERRVESGVRAKDIALLYRENKEAEELARVLTRFGISYVIESNQNIFEDSQVRILLDFLRVGADMADGESLARVLHANFLEIDPMDIYKLFSKRLAGESVAEILRSEKRLKALEIESHAALRAFYSKLSGWRKLAEFESATKLFEVILKESGQLAAILKSDEAEAQMEKIKTLFAELKNVMERRPDFRLKDFIAHVDLLQAHELAVNKIGLGQDLDRVRLMTAHGAKGQEFDYVYIVGVADGRWGGRSNRDKLKLIAPVYQILEKVEADLGDELSDQDERNLFYVALTRARKEVVISYAGQKDDGKEQLVSQFVTEIDPGLIEKVRVTKEQRVALKTKDKNKVLAEQKEYLNNLFLRRGLSVTALNNYLECPWRYFYTNLLQIPESQNKFAMYGTAAHGALFDFFSRRAQGKRADKQFLVKSFEENLSRQPLLKKDFVEVLEKGRQSLAGYYETYKDFFGKKALLEYLIQDVLLKVGKNFVPLRGKLDKIEIAKDGVVVVDYKTRQPLSAAKIKEAGYYRQLVFYKLLLDKHKNGQYKMRYGEIDFIEPNETGKYKKEMFEISEKEVAELEAVVNKTAQEILDLSFWNQWCENKKCEYCELRSF